jgi:nucleoside-diphosphate-sugar epimerase
MVSSHSATLVTGGNGFLGSLVAAAMLAEEQRRLLLPVRSATKVADCTAKLRAGLEDYGISEADADELLRLATIIELPALQDLEALDQVAKSMEVDEIVHCAGCVDYFDKSALRLANIDLTTALLAAASRWNVHRFLYISTAYCSGYRSDTIPERLHPDPSPDREPTEYTRSKRIAERLIANNRIPFLIIRPSIIIGHSETGKYTGKNYGLYQLWRAFEGLLCKEYSPIWYTVAPPAPLDFIHQDAFQSAFIGIYHAVPSGAIVHLVADPVRRPTLRDLFWQWAEVYWPLEIHGYAQVDDVPLDLIPRRQRRFLEFSAKNFEIATGTWRFERTHMDQLVATGLNFVNATLDSIARCQRRYIETSQTIRAHMRRYANRPGGPPRLVDMWQRAAVRPEKYHGRSVGYGDR